MRSLMPLESWRSTGRGNFTCRTSLETGARFMRTMPRKDAGAFASGSCAQHTAANTRDGKNSFSMLVSLLLRRPIAPRRSGRATSRQRVDDHAVGRGQICPDSFLNVGRGYGELLVDLAINSIGIIV